MKNYYFTFLLLVTSICSINSQNLVPNPSFEVLTTIPGRWILNDVVFENLMEEWTTPNQGSPDILFEKLMGKMIPPRRGYNLAPHRPRTGKIMTGIKTYGCETNTQHCKEYLQIKLTERIEKGEEYYLEFWVNPMSTSIYTNNIGVALSDVEIQDQSDYGIYYFEPIINEKKVVDTAPNDWHKIAGKFIADGNYQYILIGNFYADGETEIVKGADDISYSYYLIDDVMVKGTKKHNSFEQNLASNTNKPTRLENVLFESSKADLLPIAFAELDELANFLLENEKINIQIHGHTDNQGEAVDNIDLSKRRALAVVEYLVAKGIQKYRLPYDGFGEKKPIVSNDTPEGQALNRRVEFRIFMQ